MFGSGAQTHGGVFPQLAERREGLLVSRADLIHDQAQLCRQLVRLHDGHLHCFLLPLPAGPVVSHSWSVGERAVFKVKPLLESQLVS